MEKQKRLAQIESDRFSQLVESLGSDTLKEMARAGPELQVLYRRGPPPLRGDTDITSFRNTNVEYKSEITIPSVVNPVQLSKYFKQSLR